MRIAIVVLFAVLVLSAPAVTVAQSCEITGTVPQSIRSTICGIATSVHGEPAPLNRLIIIVTNSVAIAVRAQTPDAENALLSLLDAWTTQRGVVTGSVEVYYGRVHLATARPRVFRGPVVDFH